jgi:HEAT repeat protein
MKKIPKTLVFCHLALCARLLSVSQASEGEKHPVSTITKGLRSPDKDSRIKALRELLKLGENAKDALPELIDAMRDEDADVFYLSTLTAARIGPAAIPRLTRELGNKNARIRAGAARSLGELSWGAKGPLPLDSVVRILVKNLKDRDSFVREETARALGGIKDEKALPFLIDTLRNDENRAVRRMACTALGWFKAKAEPAIPTLVEIVKKNPTLAEQEFDLVQFGQQTLQEMAVTALVSIGSASAIPLVDILKDKNVGRPTRLLAGFGLCYMRDTAYPAVPTLIKLLSDPDKNIQYKAIATLGNIGPKAEKAVPFLIEIAKNKSAVNRVFAAAALYGIDHDNPLTTPTLIDLLEHGSSADRYYAAVEVRNIIVGSITPIPEHVLPALVEALQDKDRHTRSTVVQTLSWMGSIAVPALQKALKDEDPGVRDEAERALKRIQSEQEEGNNGGNAPFGP